MSKNTRVIKTPKQYQGKWVAWSNDHSKVVASGETPNDVLQEAIKKGEPKPWLDKVPSDDEFYGGVGRMS